MVPIYRTMPAAASYINLFNLFAVQMKNPGYLSRGDGVKNLEKRHPHARIV